MLSKRIKFPGIFRSANAASVKQQRSYFRLLKLQLAMLLIASGVSVMPFGGSTHTNLVLYTVCLAIGLFAALYLGTTRPNQAWYHMRALAESTKTLSWRYMMLAEPFDKKPENSSCEAHLAERIHKIITSQNRDFSELITSSADGLNVTEEMKIVRNASFEERKLRYQTDRIDDQFNWYRKKAEANKKAAKRSLAAVVLIYFIAIFYAIAQLAFINSEIDLVPWLTEPLLVLAASVLGFIQAKRFSELATSYSLTQLEIGVLKERFLPIEDPKEFADFVAEAEGAFSREHTQWLAKVSQ